VAQFAVVLPFVGVTVAVLVNQQTVLNENTAFKNTR